MFSFAKRPLSYKSSVCEEPDTGELNSANAFVPQTLKLAEGETYEDAFAEDGLTEEEKIFALGRLDKAGRSRASGKTIEVFLKSYCQENGKKIVSGNLRLRYGWTCQTGFYPDDLNKKNQDNLLIDTELDPLQFRVEVSSNGDEADTTSSVVNKDSAIFSVFDGHGRYGTECSTFAASKTVKNFVELHQQIITKNSEESVIGDLYSGLATSKTVEKALVKTMESVNTAMHKRKFNRNRISFLDDTVSGTTAICVVVFPDELVIANVGDSRAIMGYQPQFEDDKNSISVKQLSIDQTPFRKDERDRCSKAGAVIMTMDQVEGYKEYDPDQDDFGTEEDDGGDPPRLWLPNSGTPGVAFTRSLGDELAESIGCIATPEVLRIRIKTGDKFIVIASDGVFEFLSSQTVAEMVSKFDDPHEAAKALVAEAYKLWLHYEVRTDDITAIVIFLDPQTKERTLSAGSASSKSDDQLGTYTTMDSLLLQSELRPVRREMSRAKRQLIAAQLDLDEDEEETETTQNSPPPKKTEAEIEEIKASIRANFLFQHLTSDQLSEVLKKFTRKELEANEVVIQQGDKGDSFYVVSEGIYDCYLEDISKDDHTKERCLVHTYESSGEKIGNPSFGELALMFSEPRAATIIARTKGSLWSLDRATFRKIMIKKPNKDLIQSLRSVPIFEPLGKSQLQRLADIVSEKRYKREDIIITQGDVGDEMFIVTSGQVKVTIDENYRERINQENFSKTGRTLKLKDPDSESTLQKPHRPHYQNPFRGSKRPISPFHPRKAKEVMRIQAPGYFGERALLQSEPRAASVIAIEDTVCLCINRVGFESILGSLSDIIKRHSKNVQASGLAVIGMKENRRLLGINTLNLKTLIEDKMVSQIDSVSFKICKFRTDEEDIKLTNLRISLKSYERSTAVENNMESIIQTDRLMLLLACTSLEDDGMYLQKKTSKENQNIKTEQEVIGAPDVRKHIASFIPKVIGTIVGKNSVHIAFDSILCGHVHDIMASQMPEKSAAFAVACIISGLGSLHAKHILCRSISPVTLMLDASGYIVLTDLGFGKLLDDERQRTFTMCGYPAYLAPEQILNKGYGLEIDWWALGVFLFELLHSRLPFDKQGETSDGAARYSKIADFDPSNVEFDNVSLEGQNLIKKLLDKDPKTRALVAPVIMQDKWFDKTGIDVRQLSDGAVASPFIEDARRLLAEMRQNTLSDSIIDEDVDDLNEIPKESWLHAFAET